MTSIIRKQRAGEKPGGFLAGAMLILLASCWLTPCSGMEALTQSELGELSGQTGITMVFHGTDTFIAGPTTITGAMITAQQFTCLSQGDSDGWGAAGGQDHNPGWLVLIGNGANTGYLTFTVPNDTHITIDVGTTTGACTPKSDCPGFVIPANKSYFTFSMTNADIGLIDPTTVNISLTDDPMEDDNSATLVSAEMDMIGWMRTEKLMIDKSDMTSKCFIWAH